MKGSLKLAPEACLFVAGAGKRSGRFAVVPPEFFRKLPGPHHRQTALQQETRALVFPLWVIGKHPGRLGFVSLHSLV